MPNFSNDSHLLKWEPDVFRLCRFPQQKLAGGAAGVTAAGAATLTDATSGDFVNAGVTTGHVIQMSKSGVYDDYFPVASRTSATALALDAPAKIFSAQTGVTWSIYTFGPQHEEAHYELCERFGIDDADANADHESQVFNARALRRASVFRVLEMVFRAQASGPEDLFYRKAERYRQLYEQALEAVKLRFDADGDKSPDKTKDAASVDLRVEEAGDRWTT
jgi:hypothetical protein